MATEVAATNNKDKTPKLSCYIKYIAISKLCINNVTVFNLVLSPVTQVPRPGITVLATLVEEHPVANLVEVHPVALKLVLIQTAWCYRAIRG